MRTAWCSLCAAVMFFACSECQASQGRLGQVKSKIESKAAQVLSGVSQLPGDDGKVGRAYTVGATSPLVFALRSAEYTLQRFVVGTSAFWPTKEQKLLVLKFTVQNPNKIDTLFRFDSFLLTAVDSKDVNHRWIGSIAKENENKEPLQVHLKPAQKVEVVGAIVVPADASVPKLIVQHRSGGRVLRYDLRGLIKRLPAPFADPADTSGFTARADVPAEKETFYPLQHFDVKFVSSALTTEKLGRYDCGAGKQFCVVTIALRNGTNLKQRYRFDTLRVRVVSTDGEKEDVRGNLLLKGARDEDADALLEPGEEYTCRLVLRISRQAQPAKVIISQGESHAYSFDVK